MMSSALIAHCGTEKISRHELSLLPAPLGTATHQVIPHHEVVGALIETLGFRHIAVHKDEYAVSPDGNKMFGLMELDETFTGCRFAIGLRNSHDKSMRLAMTVGYRVFVCDNMSFAGDFTPVLAKHTKNFQLGPAISRGVDDMQRNFAPMVQSVERWRADQLTAMRVNVFKTTQRIIYWGLFSGVSCRLLIQTCVGAGRGWGGLRTKRSG
jgi:hypothetical protein